MEPEVQIPSEAVVESTLELMPEVRVSIYDASLKAFKEVSLVEAQLIRDTFMENLPTLEKAIADGVKEQAKRDGYNNFLKSQSNGN